MKIIAVITARSGSKSIPDKNIRNLGGIPLLEWSLKALSKSTMVDEIIFSSDSNSYFEIAKSIAISLVYFAIGVIVFYLAYFSAKNKGTLINMGE